MRKIKTVLTVLILMILFVCFGTTKIEAATVIKEMTNSSSDINYEVIEQNPKKTTVTIPDADSSSIYNKLTNGKTWGVAYAQLGRSQNIYCAQRGIPFQDNAIYSLKGKHTGAWGDYPQTAWILASGLNNKGTKSTYQTLSGQLALWGTMGEDVSEDSVVAHKTAMEANAYADYAKKRLASQKETGSDYKYPEVKQTNPENNDGLVGPFKIDYMYGEYDGKYYVAGISTMLLKDEKGNTITYSTKDLGNKARWYIANKNGTPLDNGNYGNKPKPNQEFYIKLVNFSGSKGYVTFKIQKIEIKTSYIICTGYITYEAGGYSQCDDCKQKDASGCNNTVTFFYWENGSYTTHSYYCEKCGKMNPVKTWSGGYASAWTHSCTGYVIRKAASVKCGATARGETRWCAEYINNGNHHVCGKKIGTGVSINPKNGVETSYTIRCNYNRVGGKITSQEILVVEETVLSVTEVDLNFEMNAGKGVDLSLRKFITGLNDQDITNRVPKVDTTPIKNGTDTTSIYNHTKEPVKVKAGDLVEYTIRVYNEGGQDAYAAEVTDYLPTNLEFVSSKVDGVDYGWKVTSTQYGRTVIKTTYLQNKVLKAFSDGDKFNNELAYRDLKVICKVKASTPLNEKITNIAEITKYLDKDKKAITTDIDSQPANVKLPAKNELWPDYNGAGQSGNYVKGQQDDDDFEKLILAIHMDLSLRKFVTGLNDQDITNRVPTVVTTPIKNGTDTTSIYNHTKEPVKVKSGDLVEYTIRVYNEGTADGYAVEVTDYLPTNLEFVSSKVDGVDYGWKVTSTQYGRTVIKTTYLQDKVLKAFSDGDKFNKELAYRDLKVICKVKDTAVANEKITNIAEITKYKNHLGNDVTTDIDSQPANIKLPAKNADWPSYKDDQIKQEYVPGQQDDDDFEKLILWYTDMGGTVWVDAVEGKQEERDNKLTGKDTKLKDIVVYLYEGNNKVSETKTDANGNYKFERREVNKKYTVKFAYGGQQYMPVNHVLITNQNYKAENSAGYEVKAERNALNAKFFEIVNGTSKLSNGSASVALKYTKDTNKYTSTLIRDEALWNASLIWATTGEFSGTIKNEAIHNINLGLYERAQINFGILTDVVSVDTTIRGQTQTHTKGQRDAGLAMNVEAKVDDILNNKTKYNQAIYKSDYNYRISDYSGLNTVPASELTNSQELEVYVTYKIDINNYSSKPGQITELVHYYTKQYELDKAWYNDGNNQVTINTSAADSGVSDYNAIYLKDQLKNVTIESNGHMYIYIRYKVNKDESGNILLGEKYTYTEITGYSSAEGLIDTNSEPGNMNMQTVDNYVATYEDDTDRAPGINLVLSEDTSRQLVGFVFEDMVAGTDAQGVNIGNGNFNESETDQKIDGVRVQLIELVKAKDGKTYEYIWQEMYTGSGDVSYMDRNGNLQQNKKQVQVSKGEYNFTDILPGQYIVRFIYGDTAKTLNYTGQDFKSTKYVGIGNNSSAAKDNKERRKQVMDYSTTITNEKGEILSATTQDNPLHTKLLENTWMNADTAETLQINIDTQKYASNVNLGLIRRPKTELTMVKEITGLKVTHNGIIYVDTANGIETGLQKIEPGIYRLALEDELLNGATLEVTYSVKIKNTGRKDTLYNYFEGDANYGSNQYELITTSADRICDYPENIGYDEELNPDWTTQNIDISILSKEVQEKINTDKPLVITTTKLTKALKPGEETEAVEMTTSKLMAAGGGDNMIYSNVAEIVQVTNSAGRRDESSTPGNYVPLSHDTSELDTDDATITVTDPEGSKAPEIYYILSITIGAMLIAGIVFIKKFVNKK